MALKATVNRQKSFGALEATINANLEDVLADLGKLLARWGSGEHVGASQLGILPRELLAHLKRLLTHLLKTDDAATAGELEVRARGREVRSAFMDTRQELMRVRDLLRNAYGEQAEQLLVGVPRQIPRNLVAGLLRMCRYTIQALRDPEIEVSIYEELEQAFPKGRETFAAHLKKSVDRLREVNRRHVQAQVRLEGARAEKIEAMEEYNRSFPEIAKIFVCLFRLAGHTELAEHLQPSGQEKGLLKKLVKLRRNIRAGIKAAKEKQQQEEATAEVREDSPSS